MLRALAGGVMAFAMPDQAFVAAAVCIAVVVGFVVAYAAYALRSNAIFRLRREPDGAIWQLELRRRPSARRRGAS